MSTPSNSYFLTNAAQDLANLVRSCASAATAENGDESVQPPTEMSVLRCGCFFLRSCSWLKLPRTPGPSVLSPGYAFSTAAKGSCNSQAPCSVTLAKA